MRTKEHLVAPFLPVEGALFANKRRRKVQRLAVKGAVFGVQKNSA